MNSCQNQTQPIEMLNFRGGGGRPLSLACGVNCITMTCEKTDHHIFLFFISLNARAYVY